MRDSCNYMRCFTRTVALPHVQAALASMFRWLTALSVTHHQLAYIAVSFSDKANLHVSLNSYYS